MGILMPYKIYAIIHATMTYYSDIRGNEIMKQKTINELIEIFTLYDSIESRRSMQFIRGLTFL